MMAKNFFIHLFVFTLLATLSLINMETIEANEDDIENSTKILSRKKRFLVFPDGSSFQLVLCTQNQGYIHVGDIVWFGNTAALAWELPTDPMLFYMLKKDKFYGNAERRQDSKHIVYFNENGKVLSAVPYRKKFIVNPAFAKRSIDDSQVKPLTVRELHERQKNRSYLYDLEETSAEFHRQGRKSLYVKIETFFKGLGYRGKECVLRMLCESSRLKTEQGTFFEEIMRATFTFPRSNKVSEVDVEYDLAHRRPGDCAQLYPECKDLRGNRLFK